MQTRREFLKQSAVGAVVISTGVSTSTPKPILPKWKGFNFLDFFNPDPTKGRTVTPEKYFKYMQDWGFDFVRIPISYPYYLQFDRSRNIQKEQIRKINEAAVEKIESFVFAAQKYGHHVSLNLHRAPGYCINAGFVEPYNLWKDQEALEDFAWHWEFWSKRFKSHSSKKLSFDLLNEPSWREDMNDQFGKKTILPGELYKGVAQKAVQAIREVNPDRLIIADGNEVGTKVTPELIDLKVAQSCRGYAPGIISHYAAPWVFKDSTNLPELKWPGQVGEQYLSREMLEEIYAPWIELKNTGIGVHCGECGCYNKTPYAIFLAWFSDVLDILGSNGIGFGLWELSGSFGILNSGRADVDYVNWYGDKLDKRLLNLLQKA